VPHDSFVHKYYVKAEHGYRHSLRFTLQDFHEPLQITPHSLRGRQRQLRALPRRADPRLATRTSIASRAITGGLDCVRCHAAVAHGALR
jgi:cytochrome c nitrite reductase small subunit